MRVVLQRVTRGEVHVAGELVGAIDSGLVALVGIAQDDGPAERVTRGEVHVAGELVGAIDNRAGLVALVGIAQDDGAAEVDRLAQKTAQLRIFRDDQQRMNRSALDLVGAMACWSFRSSRSTRI